MTELQVNFPCECGTIVIARAADAGGAISCDCGRSIAVPKLSELRMMAGAEAFITNPVEAIRKAQRPGNDPAGDQCILCGSDTPVFYECTAICEQSHVKRSAGDPNSFVRWFFLPVILNMLLWFLHKDQDADRQGHDVEVTFCLPVCNLCASSTGDVTRPSVAKKLMPRVPLYKELLNYYPKLALQVVRTARQRET